MWPGEDVEMIRQGGATGMSHGPAAPGPASPTHSPWSSRPLEMPFACAGDHSDASVANNFDQG